MGVAALDTWWQPPCVIGLFLCVLMPSSRAIRSCVFVWHYGSEQYVRMLIRSFFRWPPPVLETQPQRWHITTSN
jgi:hypothetical protein